MKNLELWLDSSRRSNSRQMIDSVNVYKHHYKKKFPKLHQQSKYQIERAVSKYENCPIRLAHIWFCSFLLYEGGGGDK